MAKCGFHTVIKAEQYTVPSQKHEAVLIKDLTLKGDLYFVAHRCCTLKIADI